MSADEPSTLPDDDVFHILQTFRRRETIRYLLREDGPIKMCDVAEHVAAREHETTVAALTSTQRQRVYIPLYQSHLPKLDEAGVIEYDKPRGIVRPTDGLEQFRPYLEVDPAPPIDSTTDRIVRQESRRDRRYYGSAIAASVGLLLASAVNVVHLPGSTLAAVVTALFALATTAHLLERTAVESSLQSSVRASDAREENSLRYSSERRT